MSFRPVALTTALLLMSPLTLAGAGCGDSASDSATTDVIVPGTPTAVDDGYEVFGGRAEIPVERGLLANDRDLEGAVAVAELVMTDSGGSAEISADGAVIYQAPADFTGLDGFHYRVVGGEVDLTAEVTVRVHRPVDDTYTIVGKRLVVPPHRGVLVNDDISLAGRVVAWQRDTDRGGIAEVGTAGGFTYVPAINAVGTDTFTYVVCDFDADVTVTVSIVVTRGADDRYLVFGRETTIPASSGVRGNDGLPDGVMLQPLADAPTVEGGRVTLAADGGFTYTSPFDGFIGTDGYAYALTFEEQRLEVGVALEVGATRDNSYRVHGAGRTITAVDGVLANDAASAQATVQSFNGFTAQGGIVAIDFMGAFTYTAPNGFSGADHFDYTADDFNGTDVGRVHLTVGAANDDRYLLFAQGDPARLLVAGDGGVLANDTSGDDAVLLTTGGQGTAVSGVVVIAADGGFDYTAPGSFAGADSFSYSVEVPPGLVDGALVSVDVARLRDDAYTVPSDGVVAAPGVLGNDDIPADAAPDGTPITTMAGGTATVHADGSVRYQAAVGVAGPDAFDYRVVRGLDVGTATVTLTVDGAVNDLYTVLVPGGLTVDATDGVLANDLVSGPSVTSFDVTSMLGGTIEMQPTGGFSYSRPADRVGDDTFGYTVTSDQGVSSAVVTVELGALRDDVYVALTGTSSLSINPAIGVLVNDVPEGGLVAIPADTATTEGGHITLMADGGFVYTSPGPLFIGEDRFDYTAERNGATATAAVLVRTVGAPDLTFGPVHGGVFVATDPDEGLLGAAGPGAAIVPATETTARGGSVTIAADGTFDYAASDAVGSDTFPYAVVLGGGIAVGEVTMVHAGARDDLVPTFEDTLTGLALLANDSLSTNATINGFETTGALGGTLSHDGGGLFSFTAAVDTAGAESFDYTASDGGLIYGATVTIDRGRGGDDVIPMVGRELSLSAAQGLLSNDTMPVSGGVLREGGQAVDTLIGSTVEVASDGGIDYLAPVGATGATDRFKYHLDALANGIFEAPPEVEVDVQIQIFGVNPDSYTTTDSQRLTIPPPGVLLNDGLPASAGVVPGTITGAGGVMQLGADGRFTYFPVADAGVTTDTFDVIVTLPGSSAMTTVTIEILSTSADRWVLLGDSLSIPDPGVLANDMIAPQSAVSEVESFFTAGTVDARPAGGFSYTRPPGQAGGDDIFTYSALQPNGFLHPPETVTIALGRVRPDRISVPADTVTVIPAPGVLLNDNVPEGAAPMATSGTTTAGGSYTLQADGAFTYEPPAGFSGVDSFDYLVDAGPGSAGSLVEIDVVAAADDLYDWIGGVPLHIHADDGVLANDTLLGQTVSGILAQPQGTLSMRPDGGFDYTPPVGFQGSDTFTYEVALEHGVVLTAVATIEVSGVALYVSADGTGVGTIDDPLGAVPATWPSDTWVVMVSDGGRFEDQQITMPVGGTLIGGGVAWDQGPVWDAAAPRPRLAGFGPLITMADGATLRGLQLEDAEGSGVVAFDARGWTIGGLVLLDLARFGSSYAAITAEGGGDFAIEGCRLDRIGSLTDFAGDGISVFDVDGAISIRDNVIHNIRNTAMFVSVKAVTVPLQLDIEGNLLTATQQPRFGIRVLGLGLEETPSDSRISLVDNDVRLRAESIYVMIAGDATGTLNVVDNAVVDGLGAAIHMEDGTDNGWQVTAHGNQITRVHEPSLELVQFSHGGSVTVSGTQTVDAGPISIRAGGQIDVLDNVLAGSTSDALQVEAWRSNIPPITPATIAVRIERNAIAGPDNSPAISLFGPSLSYGGVTLVRIKDNTVTGGIVGLRVVGLRDRTSPGDGVATVTTHLAVRDNRFIAGPSSAPEVQFNLSSAAPTNGIAQHAWCVAHAGNVVSNWVMNVNANEQPFQIEAAGDGVAAVVASISSANTVGAPVVDGGPYLGVPVGSCIEPPPAPAPME